MEQINLIIDNVDDIFIFNLIESRFPSNYLHLKTNISRSFIEEYIKEVLNINYFILSTDDLKFNESLKLIHKLKMISETFFNQFFPEKIIERFRMLHEGYLFLHINTPLADIPWELLYDGKQFLGDKFRIGRNINGLWKDREKIDKTKLRILILVNPSLDLEEAEEEGNLLFETLNNEISSGTLELQLYSGERITKFKFLSEIQNYDIVHFAGHVVYNNQHPEGGIVLANHEILDSKEIERLPSAPYLVFLNACRSANKNSNMGLANAFLKAGVPNYIGTNWNIPDSIKTVEFAINFYRHLFDEKSVGDALFEARKYSREMHEIHELIWASYSLYGNPVTKIFKYPERRSFEAIRSDWNLKKVFNEYPTFIVELYKRFIVEKNHFDLLIETFRVFTITIISLVIETYSKFNLKINDIYEDDIVNEYLKLEKNMNKLLELAVLCGKRLNLLNLQIPILSIIRTFLLHKDDLIKMQKLVKDLEKNSTDPNESKVHSSSKNKNSLLRNDDLETFTVSFQYLLENLLIDFSYISKINFFYNNGVYFPSILFKGENEKAFYVLPIFKEDNSLKKFLEDHIGEVCIIIQDFYLSLNRFIQYEPSSKKFTFNVLW